MRSHHICIESNLDSANSLLGSKILSDVQGCKCPCSDWKKSFLARKWRLLGRPVAYIEVALSSNSLVYKTFYICIRYLSYHITQSYLPVQWPLCRTSTNGCRPIFCSVCAHLLIQAIEVWSYQMDWGQVVRAGSYGQVVRAPRHGVENIFFDSYGEKLFDPERAHIFSLAGKGWYCN